MSSLGSLFLLHCITFHTTFSRYNHFECQVSPDINNKHKMIRAAATLDVIGENHGITSSVLEQFWERLTPTWPRGNLEQHWTWLIHKSAPGKTWLETTWNYKWDFAGNHCGIPGWGPGLVVVAKVEAPHGSFSDPHRRLGDAKEKYHDGGPAIGKAGVTGRI